MILLQYSVYKSKQQNGQLVCSSDDFKFDLVSLLYVSFFFLLSGHHWHPHSDG